MAAQTYETPVQTPVQAQSRLSEKKAVVPWISWGAIFGGLASGMATFILLSLLGVAAGITAIDPAAAEPMGSVPVLAGIWTGVSMLLSAFIGGYVAARISGLSRRTDGILHGFVVWGVNTLFFVYLVTTSVGSLMGGVFNVLGQGLQATSGAVAGGGQSIQSLITGSAGGGEISQESMSQVQQRLEAGDREGAINIMVSDMGFTRERAETVADQAIKAQGAIEQLPPGEQIAQTAVSGLTRASWWLFAGVLLSMVLGIVGGFLGAKESGKRRTVLAH